MARKGRVGYHPGMLKKSLLRWTCIGVSALVVGPLVGALISTVRGVDGSDVATALVSSSPGWGLIATLLGVLLAGVAGIIAAVLVGARDGMFCMGVSLAWGAWHSGHFKELARAVDLHDPLSRLAVGGLVIGLVTAIVGVAIVWIGGGEIEDESETLLSRQSLIGVGAMVVVGGLVAWGVARTGLVGQTFAAAACGGLFGGLAARVIGHGCSGRALMAAIPVLATAAPLLAMAQLGGSFGATVYADALPGLGRIMPLDWASGLLVGLPLGLSWAASIVEQHQSEGARGGRARVA